MAICALSLVLLSKIVASGSGRGQIYEEEAGSDPRCLSLWSLVETWDGQETGDGQKQR